MQMLRYITIFALCLLICSPTPLRAEEDKKLTVTQEKRLRKLSTELVQLEERVRALNARTDRLSKKIFAKDFAFGQPRLALVFHNRIGCIAKIRGATYRLDNKVVFTYDQKKKGDISGPKQVYIQPITEGRHRLTVEYRIQGHGCGAFSYMKKYKWRGVKPVVINAVKGRTLQITIAAIDRGLGDWAKRFDIKIERKSIKNALPSKRK